LLRPFSTRHQVGELPVEGSGRPFLRPRACRRQFAKAVIAVEALEDAQDAVDGAKIALMGFCGEPAGHRLEAADLQLGVIARRADRNNAQFGAQDFLDAQARHVPGVGDSGDAQAGREEVEHARAERRRRAVALAARGGGGVHGLSYRWGWLGAEASPSPAKRRGAAGLKTRHLQCARLCL
jgi:hypothetical protein